MTLFIYAKKVFLNHQWFEDQKLEIDAQGVLISMKSAFAPSHEKTIDMVVPSLANLHSHAFQWPMAGLTEYCSSHQDSFWTWRDIMYQFLNKVEPEDLAIIAKALYIEMLKNGYTEVGEFHYLHKDAQGNPYQQPDLLSVSMIEAAIEVGINICHLPVFYQYGGFNKTAAGDGQKRFLLSDHQYADLVHSLRSRYQQHHQVKIGMAPHSLRAVDVGDLKELCLDLADNQPVHIHISEQLSEVEQCLKVYQKRPVELLYSELDVNAQWCLVHATHLNEHEVEQIAKSQAVVGICPTTEANLGDGIFPLSKFSDLKVNWGIGSDSHISVNMVEELRWLEYAQRLQMHRRNVYASSDKPMTAINLFYDAYKGGNQALGNTNSGLEIGKKANLLALKIPDQFLPCNSDQIFSKFIFSSRNNWIQDVMVSGHWVIQQGQHPLDEQLPMQLKKVMKKILSH